ncbi:MULTISPECIES: DUF7344 domain-containing protein [Halorussus]|uniref:DUF7344 domain-containing protein n=1 Tax=Halorussus TaxID=1070314 RepID=UPI00209F5FB0|nr:hypothetical protein [Halorussus vallis]USZ75239.1 hypothetical protein NGM07_17620 [Halorussus vallis]
MVGGSLGATPSERIDSACSLLAHSRRRVVLYALRGCETVAVDELVDAILRDEGTTAATDQKRERVLTSLYHKHLPKLADAGVIDYDFEDGTVAPAGMERLEPLLGTVLRHETSVEPGSLGFGDSGYGLS